ncbi:MAG: ribosome small subunit-dependent GTPase A [Bacteroidales bacterium]|nr:ribosome small subunit-dependent GTPase A [Bacteroidales bacterium]
MTLEDLGYTKEFELYRKKNIDKSFDVGRVVVEHKERYIVKNNRGEYESEITGNLRYAATDRSAFPAVGDWVALQVFEEDKASIHAVFPRNTVIERQAVGKFGEKQIIAANIDFAFIMQAADRDFNINRMERYLTLCYEARVDPILLLSKIDLLGNTELDKILRSIKSRDLNVQVIPVSNEDFSGFTEIKNLLTKGKTFCFLGSSGVGKSTLINHLAGNEYLKTREISLSTNKGKHTTSHRELIVLKDGGIVIDTPGMREVGIADSGNGLEQTFDTITRLSNMCRFSDCSHINEAGCAVRAAVESGELNQEDYHNFLKLEREKEHFQSTIAEKRKKDKDFGKMVKQVLKEKKEGKL